MRSKLKGTTLIETILYIGILTAILFTIVNFMLSTREATTRTKRRSEVFSSSEFISQHLDYILSDVSSIDSSKSSFNTDSGILYITVQNGEHHYTLSGNNLEYDGTPLNTKEVRVQKFFLEPIQDKKDVTIGVRISLEISSIKDAGINKSITVLHTIR